MKRRKLSSSVAEAVELLEEFLKQSGESKRHVANDTTSVMHTAVESEVVSLSANLERAHKESASAKAELDALCAKADLAAKENNIALAKMREEVQRKVGHSRRQNRGVMGRLRSFVMIYQLKLSSCIPNGIVLPRVITY